MISELTNQYKISKTLRFSLLPQGKTEQYFEENILQEDRERSEAYSKIKIWMDDYHKQYIESTLSGFALSEKLNEFATCYQEMKHVSSGEKRKWLEKADSIKIELRKEIAEGFQNNLQYDHKKLFGKALVEEVLYEFLDQAEDRAVLNQFHNFTTYFQNYHTTRKNMYIADEKSTSIAYRLIHENLPKFLDNIEIVEQIKGYVDWNQFDVVIKDMFTVPYYNECLTQRGIDAYNGILSGYVEEEGRKIQGLNEIINLTSQEHKVKLPQMKMLHKQILSDRVQSSYIPEKFENEQELLTAIHTFYFEKRGQLKKSYYDAILELKDLFVNLSNYELNQIYIKSGESITEISKKVYGDWSIINAGIASVYGQKNTCKNYSLENLSQYAKDSSENKIVSFFVYNAEELTEKIDVYATSFFQSCYRSDYESYVFEDKNRVDLLKRFLDSLKEYQHFVSLLIPDETERNKDIAFYSIFENVMEEIQQVNDLYNKVRNHMTKKPYSVDKFKLNFQCSTLLNGFDKNKEKDNLSVILKDGDFYYLAIMNKKYNKIFLDLKQDMNEPYYEKMDYKLLPGPNKMLPKVFLSKKGIDRFHPTKELLDAYQAGTHKKGKNFILADCHRLIDYFKDSIAQHEYREFNFQFSDTNTYPDISYFYKEVEEQGYRINFSKISRSYVTQLVEEGKLYLFQIYNKDFSECSKGTPNLHTLYFKALFSLQNIENPVYKLNGGAEVFYRPASLPIDKITHPKNKVIQNKNNFNPKKESEFPYDLVKDKRYRKNQFLFHVPITMNYKAAGNRNLNETVCHLLQISKNQHMIGIDRGERHLLYVSVIDSKGEIKEQYTLNLVEYSYESFAGTVDVKVDYHKLLDKREEENRNAKQSWKRIQGIKDLKAGYLSQAVHKICELVERYDAIIVMEDLNSGFKNSRKKVEKQVYQKFEKALIDKLNYYVNKKRNVVSKGGLYQAYQCTNAFDSFKKMTKQNGIIFYVPAWLTSKIDPTTGFVDLLKPKYQSIEQSKAFIEHVDDIQFCKERNYFSFVIDYNKYPRTDADYRKKWTICTNGNRILNFRNEAKNNEWDSKTVVLVDEFKTLFRAYGIQYKNFDLKEQILLQDTTDFWKRFFALLKLTLQMRNSEIKSEVDYLISPVQNENGEFYCSDNYDNESNLPSNADANGAYHIAKKGLWAVEQIKEAKDLKRVKLAITNKEWLEYTQRT